MEHRHLNHSLYTLAAIDNVIARGLWDDWMQLRRALREDREVHQNVARVCAAHTHDPFAQRYHFWSHYAKQHQPTT